MKCPACNVEIPSTAKFCGSCGTTIAPPAPVSEPPRPPIAALRYSAKVLPSVQRKYKVLRFIAVLMKVFAFLAGGLLVAAGLMLFIAWAASGTRGGVFAGNTSLDVGATALWGSPLTGLILFVYGVFVFIFLYAYSEWMYVFMDIEENTRITNEMLSERRQ